MGPVCSGQPRRAFLRLQGCLAVSDGRIGPGSCRVNGTVVLEQCKW
jgi:hypothetical protein